MVLATEQSSKVKCPSPLDSVFTLGVAAKGQGTEAATLSGGRTDWSEVVLRGACRHWFLDLRVLTAKVECMRPAHLGPHRRVYFCHLDALYVGIRLDALTPLTAEIKG
jgi:hypothetical protein